jgi:DNA-binding XRE family transcriptional regulator
MNVIHPLAETSDTVTLAKSDYLALIEAAEDAEDLATMRAVDAAVARGEDEYLPVEMTLRLLSGESKLRVWREHRGLSAKELAAQAGVSPSYLSEIESGRKPGSLEAMAKLAKALKLSLDDLAPEV